MIIREAGINDLDSIQELYLHLHETEKLPDSHALRLLWKKIIHDENYHILVGEVDGKLISSVTLVVIPNLTRGARPYGLIENVVTHKDYRNKGYASLLMKEASKIAEDSGCYKIMLLTGSKNEATLRFYENCGFNRNDKTAFIQWLW